MSTLLNSPIKLKGSISGVSTLQPAATGSPVLTMPGSTGTLALVADLAAYQPLDSDLTAIAGLVTTAFGRSFLTVADAAAGRTLIGAGTSSFDGVFSSLSSKPTTIGGYGITDFNSLGDARWQPLDSDLTTIAGLTATTDSFIQSKSSAWSARTIAQVKTDLGLTGTNSGDQDLSGYLLKAGGTMTGALIIAPGANVIPLTLSQSVTGASAQNIISAQPTWNTSGNCTAVFLNVTNTASGATSLLMDLQVGSTSQFKVSKAGAVTAVGAISGSNLSGTNTGDQDLSGYLLKLGGTMTGALLFTDNTLDIGASGVTRPRTGYFGTSVVAPLFTGALTGNVTGNTSGSSGSCTGNAATATLAAVATAITLANEGTDTTCFPLFGTAVAGDLGAKTNAALMFNSNTGLFSSTLFAGAFNGTLGATTPASISGTTIVGTSSLTLGVASTTDGAIILKNAANAFTTTIKTGVTGASYSLTLPTTDGNNGEVLTTNGSGVLSWGAGGSGVTGSGTSGTIPIWTGSGAIGDSLITYAVGTFSFGGATLDTIGDFSADSVTSPSGLFQSITLTGGNLDLDAGDINGVATLLANLVATVDLDVQGNIELSGDIGADNQVLGYVGGASAFVIVPIVCASGTVSAQTGTATIATFTDTTGDGGQMFHVEAWVDITAITGATIQLQVAYTDRNGVGQTLIMDTMSTTPLANLTTTGKKYFSVVPFDVLTGNATTVSVVKTVAGVSVSYDASASIIRVR